MKKRKERAIRRGFQRLKDGTHLESMRKEERNRSNGISKCPRIKFDDVILAAIFLIISQISSYIHNGHVIIHDTLSCLVSTVAYLNLVKKSDRSLGEM